MIITPFDITEHLETDADIQAFLRETAVNGDVSDFIHALNTAARASLYKSLADDGNPRFETIAKIVDALGCKLIVS